MQLEELRDNDIGRIVAWLPKLGDGAESKTLLTYPHFAQLAFYSSSQQIEQLEHSTDVIKQGNSIQTAVGLWFLSIEAYINSILRIVCLVVHTPFDEIKTQDLGTRIKKLFDISKLDRTLFYSGTFQKLEEFKRYRNELFHDRTNGKLINFHRTRFSGNPIFANQADVMQASVIALETYQALRHVIPKLDLMPQVAVAKNGSVFHAPMDSLYKQILRPYFELSLKKHSLSSSLELEISMEPLGESEVFKDIEIQVLIKSVSDKKFDFLASGTRTNLGMELFDEFRKGVSFNTEEHFVIGNYYRS